MAARLSGLFLFAALSLSLACSDRDEPGSAGGPVGPELAAFNCANFGSLPRYPGPEPRPTVAEELCAASGINMGANDVQSALTKLVKAIKTSDYTLLAAFVSLKWFGSAETLEHFEDHLVLADTCNDGLCLVNLAAVVSDSGDFECLPNGKACGDFPPGWSNGGARIWTGTPTDCSALDAATSLDVYGECLSLSTKFVSGGAGGKFDVPVSLNICSNAPSTVTPTIAKVFETSKDDTLGTNFEGIEYFNSSAVADPPGCSSVLASRAAAPAAGGGVLAGQKRGPNGLALQGGTGTKVSLFSDWGIVDLESALIQGTISKTGSGFSGATVELFCGTGTVADMTTTSGSAGAYSFDNGLTHIFQVGESCEVKASGPSFGNGSSGIFTVQKGLNTVNIAK